MKLGILPPKGARSTLLSKAVWLVAGILIVSQRAPSQEPAAGDPHSAGSDKMSAMEDRPVTPLRELVAEVVRANSQIAGAYHAWQASTHAGRQAGAFPDTQVFVQHFGVGSPRPFAGYTNSDFAYIGGGVSQDLLFPGKREARRAVADREADALHEQVDVVKRGAIEQLKIVYLQIAYIQQTLGLLHETDDLLNQIQQAAEVRYRTGGGSQQDVLKAQVQHTKILDEIAHHHQQEQLLEAQIKQILSRSQSAPDIATEPLKLTLLEHTDEELAKNASDENPDVLTRLMKLTQQDAQIEAAYKEFLPDFNIQYNYQHTAGKFRDYFMASFGIRFPNRDRQLSVLAQAYQNQERAKSELQTEEQRVRSEIKQQFIFARGSEERLKIYSEGLIPQSEAAFRSGLVAYQSGKQDFESLLSSYLDVLNFQMDYWRELADHESALVRLERLTGVDLR